MGNQGHASPERRTIAEILQTGVIGPVHEVHVWVGRAWGLQDAASARKFDKPHGFYNGIQIVERFKEEMPVPPTLHFDLWLGPAPVRPYHATYFPGPRWYRWWDFGNGTMSDLGSHDNDVAYTVLDIKQPLTIEARSPNVPVAHRELAPATMTVTYEFPASPSGTPPVRLVWHQGDSKPPGWVPAWGDRSQLFIGEKGMLLGNGKLLPEDRFKDFQTPPETLPRSPGHWVEWVNHAKGLGPVPGSNFQYSGWTTEANHLGNVAHRTGKKIDWDYQNLRARNAPEADRFIRRPEYRKGWDDILKSRQRGRRSMKARSRRVVTAPVPLAAGTVETRAPIPQSRVAIRAVSELLRNREGGPHHLRRDRGERVRVDLVGAAGDAHRGDDAAVPVPDGCADAAAAELLFLVVDRIAERARPRELLLQPLGRDNRVLVVAEQAAIGDQPIDLLIRQVGDEALAEARAVHVHPLADPGGDAVDARADRPWRRR